MKKVFIDTNILIDYFSKRSPFFGPAATIVQLGHQRKCQILVSAMSFATTSFILEAHHKLTNEVIVKKYADFVKMCHITTIDSQVINKSIASKFPDFEDAMQYYSATSEKADCIITRNKKDFATSDIDIYEPTEFLQILTAK